MKRSRVQAEDFTIGWICALPIELSAATVVLDEEYSNFTDTAQYVLGRVGAHNVVLAALPAGQYGTNSAAITAAELRSRFPSIQYWLMVGIGGGVPSSDVDIRLGDIVVSRPQNQHGGVIQYDLGKTNHDGRRVRTGSLNAPPAVLGTAVSRMQSSRDLGRSKIHSHLSAFAHLAEFQQPEAATDVLFRTDSRHNEDPPYDNGRTPQILERSSRRAQGPIVHFGLIASGNQVIKDGLTRDKLSVELGGVLCFEMEAAGLMNNFPCLVVRGICDYADSHKNKRWQPFAAASAAACAKEILSFVPSTSRAEMRSNGAADHEAAVNAYDHKVNQNTKAMFVKSSLTDELRQQYLESLRFDTINSRHATIRSAHSRTCRWIIDTLEYQSWLNDQDLPEHHGFFWIKGKPGAGKSTIMKYLLARTSRYHQDAKVVAFFFNARGEDLERTTRGMYQSILLQILENFPHLQDVLALCPPKMISKYCFRWDVDSLKTALGHAVTRIRDTPLFIFIDALDECDEDEVRDMIELFEHLGDLAVTDGLTFRTCFSSRHYPAVTITRSVGLALEEREGHQQDVEEFLRTELKAGHSKFVNEIRQEILQRASGIFLWVVLVVRILNKEFRRGNKHSMKKKLDELPNGLERLFEDIITRDNQNIEQLLICIQFVLYSTRPLTVQELYFAILAGTEPELIPRWEADEFEDSLEYARRFVLNNSKGLVEETRSNPKTMQFIHETVRDFFLKEDGPKISIFGSGENFEGRAHDRLRQCCQNYYNYVEIWEITDVPEDLPKANSTAAADLREKADRMFPLLRYAVQNVLHHSDKASGSCISQETFLQDFDIQRWTLFYNLFERHEIRRYSRQVQLLYILAEKDLPQLIKIEFRRIGGIEPQGERYGFPLSAACQMGNKNAVRALLTCHLGNRTDVSQQDLESAVASLLEEQIPYLKRDSLLPQWVARFSNENVFVTICFDEKAVNSTSELRKSLHGSYPSASPHSRMWKLLSRYMPQASEADLSADNSANTLTNLDQHVANFLELFPKHNEDGDAINAKFHKALSLGYMAVARLFLSWDVNINTKGVGGLTALHKASRNSQFRHNRILVVKKLLASGASIDMKDEDGSTALHKACRLRPPEPSVIDLLLTHGACVTAKDREGDTALHIVMFFQETSSVDIGKKLIMQGADVDAKNDRGETPIHFAAPYPPKVELLGLLLEHNASVNIKDNKGETALHKAADRVSGSALKAMKLLVKNGANVDLQENKGVTGLHLAAYHGHFSLVKLLVDNGASVDIKDDTGETVLHKVFRWQKRFSARVSANEYIELVKVLLVSGADIYATDNMGRTAWSAILDTPVFAEPDSTRIVEEQLKEMKSDRTRLVRTVPRSPDAVLEEQCDTLEGHNNEGLTAADDNYDHDEDQQQAEMEMDDMEWLATFDPDRRTDFWEQYGVKSPSD